MKILVIDDNPAFRYSLAGALGKGGYQVVMADDGEHGLALFRKENPDLVICDLIMRAAVGRGIRAMPGMRLRTIRRYITLHLATHA